MRSLLVMAAVLVAWASSPARCEAQYYGRGYSYPSYSNYYSSYHYSYPSYAYTPSYTFFVPGPPSAALVYGGYGAAAAYTPAVAAAPCAGTVQAAGVGQPAAQQQASQATPAAGASDPLDAEIGRLRKELEVRQLKAQLEGQRQRQVDEIQRLRQQLNQPAPQSQPPPPALPKAGAQ